MFNKWNRRCIYNVTLRTFLRWSHCMIHSGRSFSCSQLRTCVGLIYLLLRSVIACLCRTCHAYAYADVLFGHIYLQVFTQSKYFVIAGLKTVFPTKFQGVSLITYQPNFTLPEINKYTNINYYATKLFFLNYASCKSCEEHGRLLSNAIYDNHSHVSNQTSHKCMQVLL